jgi:arylsulfatase A-like enzyme
MAPEQFTRLYPESRVKIPANFLPQHPFDNGELKVRDELLAPHPRRPEVVRQHIAAYYAMISEVDFHIGRVLDALEKSGLAGNTYIFFASDNGLAVGRHGLFGKQNSYDHSMRIPLVVSGPGIPKNKRSAALCYLMDAGPTILDLAGVTAPEMAARSLRPVLNNPRAAQRPETVFAYRHFQRALRTPRHKLIEYNVNGARTTQLFDLAVDPGEMRDLAGKSEHKELVLSMRGRLQTLLAEYGDRTILDSPAWPEFPR